MFYNSFLRLHLFNSSFIFFCEFNISNNDIVHLYIFDKVVIVSLSKLRIGTRWRGQVFFLTYIRMGNLIDLEEFYGILCSSLDRRFLETLLVSLEYHKDGEVHFHV